MRGSLRPNKTATYWLLLLWPSALCISRSPGLLNWRPRGPALGWMMAFFTASYQQLLGTPTQSGAPSRFGLVWLSLPHLVSSSVRSLPVWLLVLTESNNSSTPTQLPTQSLEWHVWLSSSGNNCHAFQRSLSSGAYVYECIMGFLPCPISSAKSAHAISFDYRPLECVTSFRCITLEWHVCPSRRSKYNITSLFKLDMNYWIHNTSIKKSRA